MVKSWFRQAYEVSNLKRADIMNVLNCCEATCINRENNPTALSLLELQTIYNDLTNDGKAIVKNALEDLFS